MKTLALCIALAALSGCAPQYSGSGAPMTPDERAAALSLLMGSYQPIQAYQQPFYPMQPIPRSGFSCSGSGNLISCY